jgi:hypothetical protein
LPEDARFCHKCGKPQRDEPVLVEDEPEIVAPAPAPPIPQFPPIGFHNRPAVAAALLAGVAWFLLSMVSGYVLPAASGLGLVGAGFLAVYLYQRRTGQRLSMIHGAHLGWISGVFGFAISSAVVALEFSNPATRDALLEQVKKAAASRQVEIEQVSEMMHNPSLLLSFVALMFVMFTVLPACGGALGAKFLDRK